MLRRSGHLVAVGSAVAALACASSPRSTPAKAEAPEPSAVLGARTHSCDIVARLLTDTALSVRAGQMLVDTARYAALWREADRMLADTALVARLNARAQRLLVDTTLYTRMVSVLDDTTLQARFARLSQEADSMFACLERKGVVPRR
jgi:hypothetical protein